MKENAGRTLGILGALGPMCGAEFYKKVILFTDAASDADHISVLLDGATTTPDRSAFLCRKSEQDPSHDLLLRAKRLVAAGAELIAIPCNTAHSFYRQMASSLSVPILHIVTETAIEAMERGACVTGILGTCGTRAQGLYEQAFAPLGVRCIYPSALWQKKLDALILKIKAGMVPKSTDLAPFLRHLRTLGCDRIILGCTELSLCQKGELADVTDSLSALARRCVVACGKQLSAQSGGAR